MNKFYGLPTFVQRRSFHVKLVFFPSKFVSFLQKLLIIPIQTETLKVVDTIGFHTFDCIRLVLFVFGRIFGLKYESKSVTEIEYFGSTIFIRILSPEIHMGLIQSRSTIFIRILSTEFHRGLIQFACHQPFASIKA